MTSISAMVLIGFVAWTFLLLLVLGFNRVRLVRAREVGPNAFKPDNAGLSSFMQRLARAHLNCVESLPLFGSLLLLAVATGATSITDPLAPWFLVARVVQSSIHLASGSNRAVNYRFLAFVVQVVIGIYWCWALLTR